MATVTVGARRSKLAQVMVREFMGRLAGCPVVKFKNRVVGTAGDQDRVNPVSQVGDRDGVGVFSSALEAELVACRIDVAVHSLKDLPTTQPNGLALAVTPPRVEARDALCGSTLAELPPGARVGTGSPRRIAQLRALRPDVEVVPIRGNVPPRLANLTSGRVDAVILAAAGLIRLGLADAIDELLPVRDFPPAPGQGALGLEVRSADADLLAMLNSYGDPDTDAAVRAERALLRRLEGGCSVPIGACARTVVDRVELTARVTSLDGRRQVAGTLTGPVDQPERLGADLADHLRDQGAEPIVAACRELTR